MSAIKVNNTAPISASQVLGEAKSLSLHRLRRKEKSEERFEKKSLPTSQIMLSSLTSSLCTKFMVNGIDVAYTRISKDTLTCMPRTCLSPLRKSACPECLPSRNIFKVIPHLIRTGGLKVLYNGITSTIPLAFARSLSFFPCYEFCK